MRAVSDARPAEDEPLVTLTPVSIGLNVDRGSAPDFRVGSRVEVVGGLARLAFTVPRTPDGKVRVKTMGILRLQTGRIDSVDEARFTIDAYSDGHPAGRIEGRLEANGDVSLEPEGGRVDKRRGWRATVWRPITRRGPGEPRAGRG
jgi:hypothetical protein